jgi:hypothetical protein
MPWAGTSARLFSAEGPVPFAGADDTSVSVMPSVERAPSVRVDVALFWQPVSQTVPKITTPHK